ncbi:MAG: Rrf2 family transcriptional regulator [Opitutales bacterium]|jgi:Rrf2 family protein
MRLTKKAEYGLRAIINLGIAQELGRSRVSVADLATADNLPMKFLEQILILLRDADYVDTQRGKNGGYFLNKDPKTVKMGDLVRLLDGPLAPIACASQSAYEPCSCADEDHCGLRMLMIDVRNAISGILDRYTLADVVEVTLRKIRRNGVEHYFMRAKTGASAGNTPTERRTNTDEGFLAEMMQEK